MRSRGGRDRLLLLQRLTSFHLLNMNHFVEPHYPVAPLISEPSAMCLPLGAASGEAVVIAASDRDSKGIEKPKYQPTEEESW